MRAGPPAKRLAEGEELTGSDFAKVDRFAGAKSKAEAGDRFPPRNVPSEGTCQ